MTSAPAQYVDQVAGLGTQNHAPTSATLIDILGAKRRELLEELRNIEQCVEQLEANPSFEGTFARVSKILNRGKW